MAIRLANASDRAFLAERDRHLQPERLAAAVSEGRVYLVCTNGVTVGWLRWGYFWGMIPLMELLHILEDCRGQGLGRALVHRWEADMFAAGAGFVLTSTQADESAQHFYRKLGYRDCGSLIVPGQAAPELFLGKSAPRR